MKRTGLILSIILLLPIITAEISYSQEWPLFFPARLDFPVGEGLRPMSFALGNFDEDGHKDLAFTSQEANNVNILLGTGTGTFSDAVFYTAGDGPYSIAVGDFDEDGHQDLAVGGHPKFAIFRGTGTGNFSIASLHEGGSSPVRVGDFDQDGHQDLAVTCANGGYIAILAGTGTGTFSSGSHYGAGFHPQSVAVSDLDEDGHQDLAVSGSWGDEITILLGNWREVDLEIDCSLDTISQGESLPFEVSITNKTDSTVTFDLAVWVKLIGGPELQYFGPRSINLPGGQSINRTPSLGVPSNAPVRDYIVSLEAGSNGDEVIDEDSFRVRVVGSGAAGIVAGEDFTLNNW